MADQFQYKLLPDVLTIKQKKSRDTAIALLAILKKNGEIIDTVKKSSDEAKDRLAQLQRDLGVEGFKHESLCFVAREMPGRKSLDRVLLIENGVAPAVIEQSFKTGKSFTERRFKDLEAKDDED